jgi:hypothetical protein
MAVSGMQVAVLERGLVAIETAAWRRPGMIILLLRS